MERGEKSWQKTLEFLKEANHAGAYRTPKNVNEKLWARELAMMLSYATTGKKGTVRATGAVYHKSGEWVNQVTEKVITRIRENCPPEIEDRYPLPVLAFGKLRETEAKNKKFEVKTITVPRVEFLRDLLEKKLKQGEWGGSIILFAEAWIPYFRELSRGEKPLVTTFKEAMSCFYYASHQYSHILVRTILEGGIPIFEARHKIIGGPQEGIIQTYKWLPTELVGPAREVVYKKESLANLTVNPVSRICGPEGAIPSQSELNKWDKFESLGMLSIRHGIYRPFRYATKTKVLDATFAECGVPVYKVCRKSGYRYFCRAEDQETVAGYLLRLAKTRPTMIN